MLKLGNTSPLVSAPPQCEMKTKQETGAGQGAGQGAGRGAGLGAGQRCLDTAQLRTDAG